MFAPYIPFSDDAAAELLIARHNRLVTDETHVRSHQLRVPVLILAHAQDRSTSDPMILLEDDRLLESPSPQACLKLPFEQITGISANTTVQDIARNFMRKELFSSDVVNTSLSAYPLGLYKSYTADRKTGPVNVLSIPVWTHLDTSTDKLPIRGTHKYYNGQPVWKSLGQAIDLLDGQQRILSNNNRAVEAHALVSALAIQLAQRV